MQITGIVHTRNSAATLERALASLRWVTELIVVDMESQDGTLDIAKRLADRVVSVPVAPRVDGIRNEHVGAASHEWLFVLDSDEWLSADAADLVDGLVNSYGDRFDAFAIPRFNHIAGQVMRGSGWYPDHQVRLFRRQSVQWSDTHHRPQVVVTGKSRIFTLTPPDCLHIHHLNYTDLRHFIRKQVEYALTDVYPSDADAFDFALYAAAAHEQLALRSDGERDGDLSRALALLMAWNSIVRGLVHWDSITPKPPLPDTAPLPESARRSSNWSIALRRRLRTHHRAARALREMARPLRAVAERLVAATTRRA